MIIDDKNIEQFMAAIWKVPTEDVKMGIIKDSIECMVLRKTEKGWVAQIDCSQVQVSGGPEVVIVKGARSFSIPLSEAKNILSEMEDGE